MFLIRKCVATLIHPVSGQLYSFMGINDTTRRFGWWPWKVTLTRCWFRWDLKNGFLKNSDVEIAYLSLHIICIYICVCVHICKYKYSIIYVYFKKKRMAKYWLQTFFSATLRAYLGCFDEWLFLMRESNLTQHSPSKQLLSKSLMCPSSSLANPMKIPDGAYSCLHGQNMTCNPMSKHLNRVAVCVTNGFSFSPAIPILVPTCSKYSQIIPGSFPDRSHIFPRSFPVLPPVPTVFQVFAVVFPLFSHFFPKVFPNHSQFCLPMLPPPLKVFVSMVS